MKNKIFKTLDKLHFNKWGFKAGVVIIALINCWFILNTISILKGIEWKGYFIGIMCYFIVSNSYKIIKDILDLERSLHYFEKTGGSNKTYLLLLNNRILEIGKSEQSFKETKQDFRTHGKLTTVMIPVPLNDFLNYTQKYS